VYGGVARCFGLAAAVSRALRRAFAIYVAQIITIGAVLVLVSLLAIRQPELLHHANVAIFFTNPIETTWQAIVLRYSPVNLDPLLLMVVLHFGLVVVLPAMSRWPNAVLLVSATLYFVSHWQDWSVPAYPLGVIYFNPLDWQLLFVVGIWWGLKPGSEQPAVLKSAPVATLAALYVLLSFFVILGWHFCSGRRS
jgi:hypothetical protein